MITYTIRLLVRGVRDRRRARLSVYDPVVQRHRAWPWYCDQNRHVNNAHYLSFMDYGRLEWLIRTGLFVPVVRGTETALVAGLGMTYRREIRWWSVFELRTQALAVEGRWIYLEQVFSQAGRDVAKGLVRVGFRDLEGLVDLQSRLPRSPPVQPSLRRWIDGADAQLW